MKQRVTWEEDGRQGGNKEAEGGNRAGESIKSTGTREIYKNHNRKTHLRNAYSFSQNSGLAIVAWYGVSDTDAGDALRPFTAAKWLKSCTDGGDG